MPSALSTLGKCKAEEAIGPTTPGPATASSDGERATDAVGLAACEAACLSLSLARRSKCVRKKSCSSVTRTLVFLWLGDL